MMVTEKFLRLPNLRFYFVMSLCLFGAQTCVFVTPALGQLKETRRVVVLSELGLSAPAVAAVVRDLDVALQANPSYRIEFYSEYLETALFPDEASQADIRAWFIRKYQVRKPDVIVAVGPTPTKFMVGAHEKFFSGIPVVFCCTTEQEADYPKVDGHFTGTWLDFDTDKTLEMAVRLLPRTKRVVVVGGVSDFDRHLEDLVRQTERKHETLQFTYLTNLPMETIFGRVKHLPHNSIVLFTSVSVDGAGRRYNPNPEIVRTLALEANAPVFTLADTLIGQGAVGGYVVRYIDSGKPIAAITLRVLQGTRPQAIEISKQAGTYMFDWPAMRRWGIEESSLPRGSMVLNRQPSFWGTYWKYVTTAIFLLLSQGGIILALLFQRLKRKQAEAWQRESQQRLEGVVQSAMDAVIAIDEEQRIVVFNPAAEKMFGCPMRDAIGNQVGRFIPERFRASHRAHIRQFSDTGITTRSIGSIGALWGLRTDGQEFPIEASISQTNLSGSKLFTVIIRDVTERRRATAALQESEKRFRLVANTAPVMIWMSGPDKLCTYFNQPWLEFTGRCLEAELGNGWAEGVHPEDSERCFETYARVFDRREPFPIEYRLRRHDGEYRWVLDSGVPRFSADGSFAGYIGSAIDVTERKLAEQALSTVNRKLIEAQEEERTRIARELHDDVNQRIALLAVNLERLKRVFLPRLRN